MRCIVIARIPTEAGNQMLKNPDELMKTFENYLNNVKAEAAYFSEDKGERTLYIVVDISSADMMPAIGEPLYALGARVEMHPAMVPEDLKKAIQRLAGTR